MTILGVYDIKLRGYDTFLVSPNAEVAERQFRDAVADENTKYGKHPEDFALHLVGTVDEYTGHVQNIEENPLVADGPVTPMENLNA